MRTDIYLLNLLKFHGNRWAAPRETVNMINPLFCKAFDTVLSRSLSTELLAHGKEGRGNVKKQGAVHAKEARAKQFENLLLFI